MLLRQRASSNHTKICTQCIKTGYSRLLSPIFHLGHTPAHISQKFWNMSELDKGLEQLVTLENKRLFCWFCNTQSIYFLLKVIFYSILLECTQGVLIYPWNVTALCPYLCTRCSKVFGVFLVL